MSERKLLKVCWEKSEETIDEIYERQAELRKQIVDMPIPDLKPIPYFYPSLFFTEKEVASVDWEKVFEEW
jgi:hypothetical protein